MEITTTSPVVPTASVVSYNKIQKLPAYDNKYKVHDVQYTVTTYDNGGNEVKTVLRTSVKDFFV